MHDHHHHGDKVFDPARAERLHDPERQELMPTAKLLTELAPLEGQTWIDAGAGTGYYTLPLAEALGEQGHVHAVDLQAAMLKLLEKRTAKPLRKRITTHGAPAERLPLGSESVDGLLIGNCYHELSDRPAFLAEVKRVVKPGGRLVIVDWIHADDVDGPLPEQGPPADHRLKLELVEAELAKAGLQAEVHRDWFGGNYVALCTRH